MTVSGNMHFDNLRTVLAGPETRLVHSLVAVFEEIDKMKPVLAKSSVRPHFKPKDQKPD